MTLDNEIPFETRRGQFWSAVSPMTGRVIARIHPFDQSVQIYAHDSYGGQSVYLKPAQARDLATAILASVPQPETPGETRAST